MTDPNDEWEVDLFSEDYVGIRRRKFDSADEILATLEAEDPDKKSKRHAANTRKPRKEGPEARVKERIRKHLEEVWRARVLRTNAGRIRTQEGHDVFLGDTGQADIHAIVPYMLEGMMIGIFLAVETKAGSNTATETQEKYLASVTKRGGVAIVAYNVIDVDTALNERIAQLREWFYRKA